MAGGVAGRLALLGAAGAAEMNSNARMRHARASKLTILVFMNHSSRPNYGSGGRIVPLFPSARPALDHVDQVPFACTPLEAVEETSELPCDLRGPLFLAIFVAVNRGFSCPA